MRLVLSGVLVLLACVCGTGPAAAQTGHLDVALIGSGGGDSIFVRVTPVANIQPYYLCLMCPPSAGWYLYVSPCPLGKPCSGGSYSESFYCPREASSCEPVTLTLRRGVSYTLSGHAWEVYPTPDPQYGFCTYPPLCEYHSDLPPVTFFEPRLDPYIRLSWASCDPQVVNQAFTGPGVYKMVLSATGASGNYSGHDSMIETGPSPIPDAWRFDDAGCQGASYWSPSAAGFTKSCPAFQGAAPLAITAYSLDGETGRTMIRLANAFDAFSATPTTRYTLWVISFDHTYSVAGAGTPGETCGGAQLPLSFDVRSEFLQTSGEVIAGQGTETHCTWNGGAVTTKPVTWGRVKDLYR